MFYGNAGSQEDLFLQGLFDSGEAKTVKALKAKIAACQAQGGTWNPETELCAVPQPYPFAISPYPYGFSSPFPTGFIGGGGGGGHHHHGHHGMDGAANFDVMYLDGLSDFGALGASVGPAQAKCISGGGSWVGPEGKKTCVYKSSQVSGPSGTAVSRPVSRPAAMVRGQMVRGQEKYQAPVASGPSAQATRLAAQKARQDAQAVQQATRLAAQKARQDAQAAQKLAHQAAQQKAKDDHAAKIAAQKSARDAAAATHTAQVAAQKADRAAKLAASKTDRASKQQAAQAAHEAQIAAHKAAQEQTKATKQAAKTAKQLARHPGIVPDVQPMPYPAPPVGGGYPMLPPGVTQVQVDRYNACLTKQQRGQKIRCYAPPGYTPPGNLLPPIVPAPVPGLTPPDWYTTPPAWWTTVPATGDATTVVPGGAGQPYSGPVGMVSGGGGGGGGSAGPMTDDSGLIPPGEFDSEFAQQPGGAGGAGGPGGPGGAAGPALAANDECNPAFSATLPQVYKDQWGDMTVLQVFCAQAPQAAQAYAPQQQAQQDNYGVTDFVPSAGGGGGSGVDPFLPYDEAGAGAGQTAEAEVTGPFGTKSITSVEAGEIGGADPMGAGAGW